MGVVCQHSWVNKALLPSDIIDFPMLLAQRLWQDAIDLKETIMRAYAVGKKILAIYNETCYLF